MPKTKRCWGGNGWMKRKRKKCVEKETGWEDRKDGVRETGARRKRWRDRKEKEGKQRVNGEMDKK